VAFGFLTGKNPVTERGIVARFQMKTSIKCKIRILVGNGFFPCAKPAFWSIYTVRAEDKDARGGTPCWQAGCRCRRYSPEFE
jgi:hypothetical protein